MAAASLLGEQSEFCPPGRAKRGAGQKPQPWHTCACGVTGSPAAQLALRDGEGSRLLSFTQQDSPQAPLRPWIVSEVACLDFLVPSFHFTNSPQTPIPTQNTNSGGREHGILLFLGQKCFVTKPSGSVNVCLQGCFAQLGQCWAEAPPVLYCLLPLPSSP